MTGPGRLAAGRLSAGLAGGAVAVVCVGLTACGSATGGEAADSPAVTSLSPGTAAPVATSPAGTFSPAGTTPPVSSPASPPAAAPRCGAGQLTATFKALGAATGHVGAEIIFRNMSAQSCHLDGYAGLTMLDAHGTALATTVHWGGSFLFPAVAPHVVGLAPGQQASFDLEYADNPAGNPPPPYQQACPAAATLKIIPPDDVTALSARVTMAPCQGDVYVSPVVPGTAPIRFS